MTSCFYSIICALVWESDISESRVGVKRLPKNMKETLVPFNLNFITFYFQDWNTSSWLFPFIHSENTLCTTKHFTHNKNNAIKTNRRHAINQLDHCITPLFWKRKHSPFISHFIYDREPILTCCIVRYQVTICALKVREGFVHRRSLLDPKLACSLSIPAEKKVKSEVICEE